MGMHYQIDPDKRLVIAWYEGQLDPEAYKSFLREVAESLDFKPDFRLLAVFCEGLDLSELSVEVMREMQAAEAAHLKRPEGSLGVIIARGEMINIISTIYLEMAAADPNLATDIRLVSTAAEAEMIFGVSLEGIAMPDYAL